MHANLKRNLPKTWALLMLPLTSTGVQYVYCTYRTVVYLYTLAEYCGPGLFLCTCCILRRRRKRPGLFPKFRVYCILGTRTAPSANVSQTIHHTHQLQELVVRGALALTSAASNGVDVTGDPYRLFFAKVGNFSTSENRRQFWVGGGGAAPPPPLHKSPIGRFC